MRGHPLLVPRIVALAALLVTVGGAVTVLTLGPAAGPITSAATDPLAAAVLLGATTALVVAGAIAWMARPGSLSALVAFWAAAAWLAPELAGSPSVTREVRSLGLWLAPMAVPLLVHLPIRTLRADGGRVRMAIIALYVTTALAATGRAITWDAFMTFDCLPVCRQHDNVLALYVDIDASLGFRAAGWWLAVLAGGALATWSLARLASGRLTRAWPVLLPGLLVGGTMLGWAAARLLSKGPSPVDPWSVRTELLCSAAVLAMGVGVSWARFREAQHAAGARRLVELLDDDLATPRTLSETIATALGDPSVAVVYPFDDGDTYVDDQGREVSPPTPGPRRAVTVIERAGTVVAVVEHDAELDPDVLSREIGAAARLAVDNERLAALLMARAREIQASRERLVAAGDAARRRLERDLHDGAQQRLLAVSYELRMAQAAARDETPERRVVIDAAVEEIDRALNDLRELAHGIWPAALAEAGLEAALLTLAEGAPMPVELAGVPEDRLAASSEAAAYLAVAEALRRAVAASATRLLVCAQRVAGSLRLEVRLEGVTRSDAWDRVEDRVGAAGGRVEVTADAVSGTALIVEVPCA